MLDRGPQKHGPAPSPEGANVESIPGATQEWREGLRPHAPELLAASIKRPKADTPELNTEPAATWTSKLGGFLKNELVHFVRDAFVAMNPVYAWRQARSSVEQVRNARSLSDEDLRADPTKIDEIVRGRLKAALLCSEFVGTYIGALGMSLLMQYSTGKGQAGVLGTMIGDYFPAVATSTLVWGVLNREYYSHCQPGLLRRLGRLVGDRIPVLWNGLKASVPAYGISYMLSSGVVNGLNLLRPGLGDQIPAWFTSQFFNLAVSEAIFLGIVFRGYDRIAAPLVKKYSEYLKQERP